MVLRTSTYTTKSGKKVIGKRRGRKPKHLKLLEEKRIAKKLKMQDKLK